MYPKGFHDGQACPQVVARQGQRAPRTPARARPAADPALGPGRALAAIQEGSTTAITTDRGEPERSRRSSLHQLGLEIEVLTRRGEVWTIAGGPDHVDKPRPAVVIQDDAFTDTASAT